MGKTNYETISKGFLNAIKQYGDIMAERTKLKTDVMANEFKARQNFFWKMMEKNQQTDYQKKLMQMFDQQQAGFGATKPYTDPTGGRSGYPGGYSKMGGIGTIEPLSERPKPVVTMGTEGYRVGTPKYKEWVMSRITEKENRGMALNPAEKRFKEKYLGVGEAEPFSEINQWQMKQARNALFSQWINSISAEFDISRYRTPEGKVDARRIMQKLRVTIDDFYNWSKELHPDLAEKAFPGRFYMERTQ